jgi:acetyl-CoA C-acetyltransferase
MIETGEIVAQNFNFSQEQLDKVAYESYSNAFKALSAGKYDKYLMKMKIDGEDFDKDEYIMNKTGFVEKPERFAKASAVFEHPTMGGMENFYKKYQNYLNKPYKPGVKGAVTLFNSCPQSDGAGAMIITTLEKAQELGLPILAKIVTYAMKGVDPAIMGIGMAYAGAEALKKSGLSLKDIGFFELHEAFAATFLGTIYEMTDTLKLDMKARYLAGDINRNGGTLAMGHPLGATGIRVLINQILEFENDQKARYSLSTVCAGGGVAGSFILERP